MPKFMGGKDRTTNSSSVIPFPMDGKNYAAVAEAEHVNVHKGNGYICSGVQSLAIGEIVNLYITNPTSNFPHLHHWSVDAESAPILVTLNENPTLASSASASDLPVNNAYRGSTKVTSMGITIGTSVSNVGTNLETSLITGTKKIGGDRGGRAIEWNLKDNEDYLIQINNQSGGNTSFSYFLFWYQPLQVA